MRVSATGTAPRFAPALDVAFAHALDAVGQGIAFYDLSGALIYQNAWVARAIELPSGDAFKRWLSDFVQSLVRDHGRMVPQHARVEPLATRELPVSARPARRLTGSIVGYDLFSHGATFLVTIDTASHRLHDAEELKRRFQLTPAETRIAFYIVEGLSTEEIAEVCTISRHTVRRHVEKVLRKLGAPTRQDVSRVLAGPALRR